MCIFFIDTYNCVGKSCASGTDKLVLLKYSRKGFIP